MSRAGLSRRERVVFGQQFGKQHRAAHWLLTEQGTAVTSDFALEEARRNVEQKRPAWQAEFERLVARVTVVPSVRFALAVELAEKDVPILCTAIRAGCQALATGDKRHFGPHYGQDIEGVRVVSLLQLAEMLTAAEQ